MCLVKPVYSHECGHTSEAATHENKFWIHFCHDTMKDPERKITHEIKNDVKEMIEGYECSEACCDARQNADLIAEGAEWQKQLNSAKDSLQVLAYNKQGRKERSLREDMERYERLKSQAEEELAKIKKPHDEHKTLMKQNAVRVLGGSAHSNRIELSPIDEVWVLAEPEQGGHGQAPGPYPYDYQQYPHGRGYGQSSGGGSRQYSGRHDSNRGGKKSTTDPKSSGNKVSGGLSKTTTGFGKKKGGDGSNSRH